MRSYDPERVEAAVGVVFRVGGLITVVLLLTGLAAWVLGYRGAADWWLLTSGFVLLMLLPVTRVAFTVVDSIRQRQWFFAAMGLTVLLILTGTLYVALRA